MSSGKSREPPAKSRSARSWISADRPKLCIHCCGHEVDE